MKTVPRLRAKDMTWLPVEELQLTDRTGIDLVVNTPHKEKVVISTTERRSNLFSSPVELNVDQQEIIEELTKLEQESINYLVNQWKKTLK